VRVVWHGATNHSSEELLPEHGNQDQLSALTEAEEYLREVLSNGRVATADVYREARQLGISIATLRRARNSLKVEGEREGFGLGGKWFLRLPKADIDGHDSA
jgi:hypothetical protein